MTRGYGNDANRDENAGKHLSKVFEIAEIIKRKNMDIKLVPLTEDDREKFILDNQEAFNYGALQEFGRRDDHFEEDGEIISRRGTSTST